MSQGAIEPSPELEYLPEVSLYFNPDDLTDAELSRLVWAQEAHDDPKHALHHALLAWHLWAVRHLREDVAKGLVAYDQSGIAGAINTLWQIYFPIFQRATAPSLASAYTQGFLAAKAGQVDQEFIYALANAHAKRIGDYYHETSREALLQGFNGFVNRKVAAKTATERAIAAYGLSPKQMSGYVAMEPEKTVLSVSPLDLKARMRNYITTSIQNRLKVLVDQEDHNLEQQASQTAWLWMVQHGQMDASTEKVWFTAKDERVCPICGPMHGKAVPVGEKFVTEDGAVYVPGVHVNCRCWVKIRVPRKAPVEKALDAGELFEFNREHPRGRSGQFARKPRKIVGVMERTTTNQGFDQIMRDLAARTVDVEPVPETPQPTRLTHTSTRPSAPTRLSAPVARVEPQPTRLAEKQPTRLDAREGTRLGDPAPEPTPSRINIYGYSPAPKLPEKEKRYREVVGIADLRYPIYAVLGPQEITPGYQHYQFTHDKKFQTNEMVAVQMATQLRNALVRDEYDRITQDGSLDRIPVNTYNPVQGQGVQVRLSPQDVKDVLDILAANAAGELHGRDDYMMLDHYTHDGEWLGSSKTPVYQLADDMGLDVDDFRVQVVEVHQVHESNRGNMSHQSGTRYGQEEWSISGPYEAVSERSEAYHRDLMVPIVTVEPHDPEIVREEITDDWNE